MPVNKAAYLRHEIIDECLRNSMRKWSKSELLKVLVEKLRDKMAEPYLDVSEATLRNDLVDMETEYGAPITTYTEGRKKIYKYSEDWSIKNLPIETFDVAKLKMAVDILQQIQGFGLADELRDIVDRLERKIKNKVENSPCISFENNPTAQGTDNLGDIYESILSRNILKITYKPFKAEEPYTLEIHPYYLKEYNNRWFLFGWNEELERVELMALDRMVKITVANGLYKDNCFDPVIYFANIIGVTNMGTSVEKILLMFDENRAPYVISRKLHPTQKEKVTNAGKLLVEMDLQINKELQALILSFGEDVEVLEPAHLKDTILAKLKSAMNLYGE